MVRQNYTTKLLYIFFLSLLSIAILGTQTARAAVAEVVLNSNGNTQKLLIEKAAIDATLHGNEAKVTYTLHFASKDPIAREGKFYFDVPKGAYIHDFKFMVNGEFKQSILVDAKAGRVAYESIVRRKVDPALMEWTAGNRFKMRVYPIRENQPVSLQITLAIPATKLTPNVLLNIPSDFQVTSQNQNAPVSIKFDGFLWTKTEPKIAAAGWKSFLKPNSGLLDSIFGKDTHEVFGEKNTKLGKIPRTFKIIAKGSATSQTPSYERKLQKLYFLTSLKPKLKSQKLPHAKDLYLFWDTSLSEKVRVDYNLSVLKEYLKQKKNQNIVVIPFAHKVLGRKVYRKTSYEKIAKVLKTAVYDGATRIAPLLSYIEKKLPKAPSKATDILIVSNFVDSYELHDLKGSSRLISKKYRTTLIVPDSGANDAYLQHVSKRLGAPVLTHSDILSGSDLRKEAWSIAAVTSNGGNQELTTIPNNVYFPGNSIQILGRASDEVSDTSGTIKLVSQTGRVKKLKWKFESGNAEASNDSMVSRRWAKLRLDSLLSNKQKYREEIKEISLAHQQMSPYVVRVVLESCSDYKEFKLPLPSDCDESPRNNIDELVDGGDDDAGYDLEEDGGGDYGAESNAYSDEGGSDEEVDIDELADEAAAESEPVPLADVAEAASPAPVEAYGFEDEAGESDTDVNYYEDPYAPSGARSRLSRKKSNRRIAFDFEANLKGARTLKSLYSEYLKARKKYSGVMYLYVLTAQLFHQKFKQKAIAERILSNVVELRPGEARWLRVYAYFMGTMGDKKEFLAIGEAIIRLREEEPQSYRDLGLELERLGRLDKAYELFKKVALGKWDNRLVGIKKIADLDMARVAYKLVQSGKVPRNANGPIQKKAKEYKNDSFIVTVSWDADNSDVDLHIDEPGGAHVYYGNRNPSNATGVLSYDATGGYGPEQYRSKLLDRGPYQISLSFFSENPFVKKDGVFAKVQIETRVNGRYRSFSKMVHLKDSGETIPVWTFNSPVQTGVNRRQFIRNISVAQKMLKLKQYSRAYNTLRRMPVGPTPSLESKRLFHLARAIRHVRGPGNAIKPTLDAFRANPNNYSALYNAACYASLAGQKSLAIKYLQNLLTITKRTSSRTKKYYFKLMASDSDLNNIRGTSTFKGLINAYAH